VQHPARVFHRFFPRAKFTWAPSAQHRITLSANGDPAFDFYRDQSNQELAIAESGQRQGGAFTVLQWDFFAAQNLNFNVQAGYNWNGLHQAPQGQLTSIDYGPRIPGLSDKNYRYDPNQPRH